MNHSAEHSAYKSSNVFSLWTKRQKRRLTPVQIVLEWPSTFDHSKILARPASLFEVFFFFGCFYSHWYSVFLETKICSKNQIASRCRQSVRATIPQFPIFSRAESVKIDCSSTLTVFFFFFRSFKKKTSSIFNAIKLFTEVKCYSRHRSLASLKPSECACARVCACRLERVGD